MISHDLDNELTIKVRPIIAVYSAFMKLLLAIAGYQLGASLFAYVLEKVGAPYPAVVGAGLMGLITSICIGKYWGIPVKVQFGNNANKYIYLAVLFTLPFVWLISTCCATVIYQAFPQSYFSEYNSTMSSLNPIVQYVFVLVLAPIFEEIFFRVGVLGRIAKKYSVWIAVVVSAMCFSLSHGTVVHLVPTFILGLACGIGFVSTSSVVGSVVLHIVYNLLAAFATSYVGGDFVERLISQPIVVYLLCALIVFIYIILSTFISFGYKIGEDTEMFSKADASDEETADV